MWLVDNGSEIHLSTVADDFEGKELVFPAGYPLSIQTATGKADVAGYPCLTLIVPGTAGQTGLSGCHVCLFSYGKAMQIDFGAVY